MKANASKTLRHSVKFVRGIQRESRDCPPARPGRYATQIGIHNYSSAPPGVRKRFIPLVLAGAAIGRAIDVVVVDGRPV